MQSKTNPLVLLLNLVLSKLIITPLYILMMAVLIHALDFAFFGKITEAFTGLGLSAFDTPVQGWHIGVVIGLLMSIMPVPQSSHTQNVFVASNGIATDMDAKTPDTLSERWPYGGLNKGE